jgi:hypothetical protein
MERAEFIEAQIIPEPVISEAAPAPPLAPPIPPSHTAPVAKPKPVAEPPFVTEPVRKESPTPIPTPTATNVEAKPSTPPAESASGPAPVRDVEELARAIADLGKNSGEPAKISSSIQGAKVIEAEVLEPGPKNPAPESSAKSDEPAKAGSDAEAKLENKEQGFRPFQRLRRFFSPAGK